MCKLLCTEILNKNIHTFWGVNQMLCIKFGGRFDTFLEVVIKKVLQKIQNVGKSVQVQMCGAQTDTSVVNLRHPKKLN